MTCPICGKFLMYVGSEPTCMRCVITHGADVLNAALMGYSYSCEECSRVFTGHSQEEALRALDSHSCFAEYVTATGRGVPARVTPAAYGDRLALLVAWDRAEFPGDYMPVKCWADLHNVCDANEYVIDANEHFVVDHVPGDAFLAAAIAHAEGILFGACTTLDDWT